MIKICLAVHIFDFTKQLDQQVLNVARPPLPKLRSEVFSDGFSFIQPTSGLSGVTEVEETAAKTTQQLGRLDFKS